MYTAGSHIASGLVVPMLLVGGGYGRFVGEAVHWLGQTIGFTGVHPGTYALIGSASFMGGVSRMTMYELVR